MRFSSLELNDQLVGLPSTASRQRHQQSDFMLHDSASAETGGKLVNSQMSRGAEEKKHGGGALLAIARWTPRTRNRVVEPLFWHNRVTRPRGL